MSLSQIKLIESDSEWQVRVFLSESERILTRCLNPRWQWLNPTWQNSSWLPSWKWVRINEWSFDWNCKWWEPKSCASVSWVWDGKTQDGCHHQDWVKIQWVAEFKMAAIIKCANGQNGSVSEVFFCGPVGYQSLQVWVSLRGKTKMAES